MTAFEGTRSWNDCTLMPALQPSPYNYAAAVSRNIGWLKPDEQERLRTCRVAVAGLGGVGGAHVVTLARLGIGHFHIADFDHFEVHNFNRQTGAFVSTLGRPKSEVAAETLRDINPLAEVRAFGDGVTPENLAEFLNGVDLYVDGIDFFAVDARRMIFAACHERGIPAVTAAPLGMGVSLMYFEPKGMSFEEYFRLEGCDRNEQLARFIAGLSPSMLQRGYLQVPEAVNFLAQRGPSTVMACDLCAGVAGTTAVKVLLQRGPLRPAPWVMQFDAYQQKLSFTWRPFGNAHPLQWLLLKLIRPRLSPG